MSEDSSADEAGRREGAASAGRAGVVVSSKDLADAEAVDARITKVWGHDAVAWMRERVGVQHVVVQHVLAVVQPAGSEVLHVLRIALGGPSHVDDAFSLALARARADQVVLTAQILREEPELSYAYGVGVGVGAEDDPGAAGGLASSQLAAWRRVRLGRGNPPELVIVTRRGDVPAGHPIFEGSWPVRVLAPAAVIEKLRASLPNQVKLEALTEAEAASPIALVDRLRNAATNPNGHTISIEAGPSFAGALYPKGHAPHCDELLLSEVAAKSVSSAFVGPAWIPRRGLAEGYEWLGDARDEAIVTRASDAPPRWRFSLLRRTEAR